MKRANPITRKLALDQAEEMASDLRVFLREALMKESSFGEYAKALSTDRLVAYTGIVRVLTIFMPALTRELLARNPDEIEAVLTRRLAEQEADRVKLVQSGGHDAL